MKSTTGRAEIESPCGPQSASGCAESRIRSDEAASNDDPVSMTFMNCIPSGVSVRLRVGCRGQRPLEEVTEASIAEQEVGHQQ